MSEHSVSTPKSQRRMVSRTHKATHRVSTSRHAPGRSVTQLTLSPSPEAECDATVAGRWPRHVISHGHFVAAEGNKVPGGNDTARPRPAFVPALFRPVTRQEKP